MEDVIEPFRLCCDTCQQAMRIPANLTLESMAFRTQEEVLLACEESLRTDKVIRCTNPRCVAPRRAVVIPVNKEAQLIGALQSWLPVATFPLTELVLCQPLSDE